MYCSQQSLHFPWNAATTLSRKEERPAIVHRKCRAAALSLDLQPLSRVLSTLGPSVLRRCLGRKAMLVELGENRRSPPVSADLLNNNEDSVSCALSPFIPCGTLCNTWWLDISWPLVAQHDWSLLDSDMSEKDCDCVTAKLSKTAEPHRWAFLADVRTHIPQKFPFFCSLEHFAVI